LRSMGKDAIPFKDSAFNLKMSEIAKAMGA
jgi:hypothetical protein